MRLVYINCICLIDLYYRRNRVKHKVISDTKHHPTSNDYPLMDKEIDPLPQEGKAISYFIQLQIVLINNLPSISECLLNA